MTAQQELVELAHARVKEEQIPFSEALGQVGRERPKLASEAREEVIKTTTTFLAPPKEAECLSGPAAAEILRLAKSKSEEDGTPFSEALLSVSRERPILASDYRREVTKSKF